MLKQSAAIAAVFLSACQPQSERNQDAASEEEVASANVVNTTEEAGATEAQVVAPEYANYPVDAAYLFHGGSVDRSIASETLQGQGPNKSLRFFVDYRAKASWTAEEYRKFPNRRYCRWSYTGNGIERILYVFRSENNKQEVANGKRSEAGSIPGPGDTADNCNSVQNNVIVPKINQMTSVDAWSSFLADDKAKVQQLLDDPI